MSNIKLILSLIIVISVYSVYEDCSQVAKDYTLKNGDFKDGKWVDTTTTQNFTFIAGSADDCKSRVVRKYKYGNTFYDSARDDDYVKTKETFLEHCCYFVFDNMENHLSKNVLTKEYDTTKHDIKVVTEEKITGACMALTEFQYKNIKDYIELMQLQNEEYINLKIDCSSHNLKFFFLSLFLLILF